MLPADERFMQAALLEARKGVGHTSPNPAVGAVLAVGEKIVARGFHRGPDTHHAEIDCLRKIKGAIPRNAILYVTLEPCSTTGRTPPCTRAIVESGVKTVVVGAIDFNPRHYGRGLDALREAGIVVRAGALAEACAALNEPFNKWIQTRQPYVIAKCGMSLDGRLTRPAAEPPWITSRASRDRAHQLRSQVDAILVGAETIRADDPRLTVRSVPGARQPWRIVLTRSGRLPPEAKIFKDQHAERTMIFHEQPLANVLAALGEKEITSVLIEGGGEVLGQALDARLIDRVQIYLGPLLTGGRVLAFPGRGAGSTRQGARLREIRYERIGDDLFLNAKAAFPDADSE